MMTATLFDSHRYAKRLVDGGIPEKAADVQAEMMTELMEQVAASTASVSRQDNKIEQLGGKIDLLDAKVEAMYVKLDAKIDRVQALLEARIAEVKAELVRWVVGVGMLQTALIAALMLKLPH
ncbi:hypothetical protein ACFOLJ_10010 [Rugamonas sp. CCM 8940]|uniref:hypothetical protein n=1 Tax=Rugamonas sp. CCM 8940 TaxID=2765359 RepID=UPI0018F5EF8A|nr:hypothetical protein [Rugamonas sp. CCM 8940]MBJ7309913.1 hypothetical protein [Rugamonas sp. CCM 8940]